ncbi:MAG TPA: hypothetical protein VLM20_01690, partial [Methylophilaceae bacterium]|nr:hypothetical protein [Methylophilaceae bacterium]
MKSKFLLALVCGVFTMHVYANEQDNNFWFPNESINDTEVDASVNLLAKNDGVITDSVPNDDIGSVVAENEVNNATRLKFTSRRAALNPAVKNKDNYLADDQWIGATYVDEQELEAG